MDIKEKAAQLGREPAYPHPACPRCNGAGHIPHPQFPRNPDSASHIVQTCPACNGQKIGGGLTKRERYVEAALGKIHLIGSVWTIDEMADAAVRLADAVLLRLAQADNQ